MDKKESEGVDISLITQAAVGYVRDNAISKKAAEQFVSQVRVHLGQILAHRPGDEESPLGSKATPEAVALMEYIAEKKERLETEKGYTASQASAIVLKDELVPLQVVAVMANDTDMIASVRKVNSHVINELGNIDAQKIDPKKVLRRKKRGRAPGTGKKAENKA